MCISEKSESGESYSISSDEMSANFIIKIKTNRNKKDLNMGFLIGFRRKA